MYPGSLMLKMSYMCVMSVVSASKYLMSVAGMEKMHKSEPLTTSANWQRKMKKWRAASEVTILEFIENINAPSSAGNHSMVKDDKMTYLDLNVP